MAGVRTILSLLAASTVVAVVATGASAPSVVLAASPPSAAPPTRAIASATSQGSSAPLGPGRQKLSPGVHVLDLVAREHGPGGPAHLPRIAITLPRGWFNYDGWGMTTGERIPRMLVSFWDVALVYETPCRWQNTSLIDPGPGVGALASVLAKRPLRNATVPKDVVLAGVRGKYLRWSVPRQIDFADCDEGVFESWTARGWASDRYQQGPGQVDRIWILNVGGTRLVLDVAYMPQATNADRQALGRIVRSIRFLR
jgi:hypothetical protein